jgi:hypothetical protein
MPKNDASPDAPAPYERDTARLSDPKPRCFDVPPVCCDIRYPPISAIETQETCDGHARVKQRKNRRDGLERQQLTCHDGARGGECADRILQVHEETSNEDEIEFPEGFRRDLIRGKVAPFHLGSE